MTDKKQSNIYITLGASNHTDKERHKDDFYATEPAAAEWLLKIEDIDKSKPIWEVSSGEDDLANVFKKSGFEVRTSDIVKRLDTTEQLDFLAQNEKWDGTIITNPPYKLATEFVEKSMETLTNGNKLCLFLKIQFLEGKRRGELFRKYPPKKIWVSSSRLLCAKNGDFAGMIAGGGSAVAYAWYIWEKGYQGQTIIDWFN